MERQEKNERREEIWKENERKEEKFDVSMSAQVREK